MTKFFLSYARTDQKFTGTVRDKLNGWGYSTWLDVDDIPKGSRWPDEINSGLQSCDIVVGIISPDSIVSTNVKNEWDWAIANKKNLILLRLKPTDVPMHYISINYIDFSVDWERGFQELHDGLIKKLTLESSFSLSPEVRKHAEKYWQLCRQFFIQSDFALAAFFAIALLDEIGSMICIGLPDAFDALGMGHKLLPKHERSASNIDTLPRELRRELAIRMTLYVNSRVVRLYKEEDARFGKWFKENAFQSLIDKSLYMHGTDQNVTVPENAISREDAFTLVCMVGEIYAEIQGQFTGVTPHEWERILKEIDTFREKYKL